MCKWLIIIVFSINSLRFCCAALKRRAATDEDAACKIAAPGDEMQRVLARLPLRQRLFYFVQMLVLQGFIRRNVVGAPREMLREQSAANRLPAKLIHPGDETELEWFIDREAASLL